MARGRKTSVGIEITPQQRQILTAWQRSTTIRAGLAKRGRVILMLAEGARFPIFPVPWTSVADLSINGSNGFANMVSRAYMIKPVVAGDLFFLPTLPSIWCRWRASGLSILVGLCRSGTVPRLQPTKPAQPGNVPNRVEHEYKRDGAWHLFAAFDTRTGQVYGQCYRRKRQKEFLPFLEYLDREIPARITLIHVVCDNVSVHHGKEVQKWLKRHPRS